MSPSNLGIIASSVAESSGLTTPLLLDSNSVAGAATSITSNTITPSSNALLIVAVKTASNTSASLTIASTTLSNVGSWTLIGPTFSGANNSGTLLLAYAKITGSAGSGTITASFASQSLIVIETIEITGVNSTPVPQSKQGATGTSTGSTYSLTLDSTPTATSTVIGAIISQQTGGITPGATFTELADVDPGSTRRLQTQYDAGNATTTVDWSGLTAGNVRFGSAIEIASA